MNARRTHVWAAVLPLVFLAGCASAGKRLEQGMEAEAGGDYHTAAARYIQALEKDRTLVEARNGLLSAWEAALAQGTAFAGERASEGDPLGAAAEYRQLDALKRDAREVGVLLPTPDRYAVDRRATLDGAIAALMDRGDGLRRDGRWNDARTAFRRVVDEMDPVDSQRQASLEAQALVLLEWAESEAEQRRYRAAFQRAGEVLEVSPDVPEDLATAALRLQEESLSSGLRVVAVFPVGSAPDFGRAALTDLQSQLSDLLETEYWRRPPLFVAVAEPARVRQIARRLSPPGTPLRPRVIVDEAGADFGVLVELVELQGEERNVRTTRRTARTRSGADTAYAVEDGRIGYTLVAEVTLFDERGIRLESFRARHEGSEDFRRARYAGSPDELEIGRGERLLFNPGEERRQRGLLQSSLLDELGREVAEGVFDRVVRRIP